MTTVTLKAARRSLAGALGGYQPLTSGVQYVMPTGTYLGIATGADAARVVVSSDLADLDYSGVSSDTDPAWYNGGFAYLLTTVPQQRRFSSNSYSPSNAAETVVNQTTTGFYAGMLTLNRPIATAMAAGTEVEIHTNMPPLSWDRGEGLHACINRALMAMPMEYSVSIVGAGTRLVELGTTIPWLATKYQLIGCYDAPTTSDSLGIPHQGGVTLEFSGNSVRLVGDYVFATGDTFTLKLWRPVGTWIKVSGTWADSTVGLVNETDEAFADPKVVELCALYYVYKTLARVHKGVGQGDYYAALKGEMAVLAQPHLKLDEDLNPEERTMGLAGMDGYPPLGYPYGSDGDSSGGNWP